MLKDEATLRLARQVSMNLASMASVERSCPPTVDQFEWSREALDELARAVSTVGDVVEAVTGGPDDQLARQAEELVTAIVRRRNELLLQAPPAAAADGAGPTGAPGSGNHAR